MSHFYTSWKCQKTVGFYSRVNMKKLEIKLNFTLFVNSLNETNISNVKQQTILWTNNIAPPLHSEADQAIFLVKFSVKLTLLPFELSLHSTLIVSENKSRIFYNNRLTLIVFRFFPCLGSVICNNLCLLQVLFNSLFKMLITKSINC